MQQTVLITGTSSGIGRAAVEVFHEKGWQVVATMRSLESNRIFSNLANVAVYPLDVTNSEQIETTIDRAIADFGCIDMVINNAGYGLIGPFEASTDQQVFDQFDTNVFGSMRIIRKILPHFRKNAAGTIVNISSLAGILTIPLNSLYHSTKFAIEGFTESLSYELEPYGIKVKLIEFGAVKSDFTTRSIRFTHQGSQLTTYDNYVQKALSGFSSIQAGAAEAYAAAEMIFESANDGTDTLRYLFGEDAKALSQAYRNMELRSFQSMIKQMLAINQ